MPFTLAPQDERWTASRLELVAEIQKQFSDPNNPQHVLFLGIATYLVHHCTVFDPTYPNGCYTATSAHEHGARRRWLVKFFSHHHYSCPQKLSRAFPSAHLSG